MPLYSMFLLHMDHPLFEIIKTDVVEFAGIGNADVGLDISFDVPPSFVRGCPRHDWGQTLPPRFWI